MHISTTGNGKCGVDCTSANTKFSLRRCNFFTGHQVRPAGQKKKIQVKGFGFIVLPRHASFPGNFVRILIGCQRFGAATLHRCNSFNPGWFFFSFLSNTAYLSNFTAEWLPSWQMSSRRLQPASDYPRSSYCDGNRSNSATRLVIWLSCNSPPTFLCINLPILCIYLIIYLPVLRPVVLREPLTVVQLM